ncbi:MAG: hypothetical protein LBD21_02980 [Tannerellaceae bacterium]|jgi:hypothetical protein|nr:hypothetical protein [Tannerellaceae bacterium]
MKNSIIANGTNRSYDEVEGILWKELESLPANNAINRSAAIHIRKK